jgi:hypothetical protein
MELTVMNLLDFYFFAFSSMTLFIVVFVILRFWFLLNKECR